MAWTTVLAELRTYLSDNATDQLFYRKTVMGNTDGTNKTFKTFEARRLTDFTTNGPSSSGPLGVFVNGAKVTVSTDDLNSGEFVLGTAPTATATLEASYYGQWFLDADLNIFMNSAINWLNAGTVNTLPVGLQPAALDYSAGKAYQNLALRWARNFSNTFRVEDQPKENQRTPADVYNTMANKAFEQATKTRDQYYRGEGKALQANTMTITGGVSDVVPRR